MLDSIASSQRVDLTVTDFPLASVRVIADALSVTVNRVTRKTTTILRDFCVMGMRFIVLLTIAANVPVVKTITSDRSSVKVKIAERRENELAIHARK